MHVPKVCCFQYSAELVVPRRVQEPFYEKDALHPPFAPNAEETRKVLNEFDKALLLTGPDGPKLSLQAIKIEHEAYTRGYYKAFSKWVEKAADKNAQVLFISSTHLGEPIAWGGPIVMNTKDELQKAFDDLNQGSFLQKEISY